jgi:hypothetical protein
MAIVVVTLVQRTKVVVPFFRTKGFGHGHERAPPHTFGHFPNPAAMLRIPATDKTPLVLLDPAQGAIEVRGVSVPENADRFYAALLQAVVAYGEAPARRTAVVVELAYFNSSTAKCLLDLFRQLEDLHATGRTSVAVEWRHAADDLDMEEAGQDYRELLEIPVKLVRVKD